MKKSIIALSIVLVFALAASADANIKILADRDQTVDNAENRFVVKSDAKPAQAQSDRPADGQADSDLNAPESDYTYWTLSKQIKSAFRAYFLVLR